MVGCRIVRDRRLMCRGLRTAGFGIVLSAMAVAAKAQAGRTSGITAFENISVAGAERNEVSSFTDAGVVSTDGVSGIVVNIVGEMRGRADREGAVGVFLVPDVSPIAAALRTRRILLASLEVAARVTAGESNYFMATQQRFDVGFPRYRVLLYNSTGAAVTASVFVNRVR